ncbi:hypothetical protein BJ912DRAFT_544381 [Pholiota molesta]|nr:hypothetical protein BJ912DRAFT_544381 [Pholiota molesta]
MLSTSKLNLPEPTYTPPDPSKKSHARRQPPGHVSRPRNAFILFRCDFVRQKKIPRSVEKDHRNISRIVGSIWRKMSAQEKEPWVKMADEEKANHMKVHPGYRFTRGNPSGTRRTKRGDEASPVREEDPASSGSDEALLALDLDRAVSCPVGAPRMPIVNLEFSYGYGSPMKTKDDLKRRPSRNTLYRSSPNDLEAEAGAEFFADIMNQYDFVSTLKERQDALKNGRQYAAEKMPEKEVFNEEDPEGSFCGPRLDSTQYSVSPWEDRHRWDRPSNPWEGGPSRGSIPWVGSLLGSPENDVDGYFYEDPDPELGLHDPSLPPIPRCPLPDDAFEDSHFRSFLSERKTSSFFSPRSGTWRLPPPVPTPAAIPANSDPSFADNRHLSSRETLDATQESSGDVYYPRGIAPVLLQEFFKQNGQEEWSDATTMGART